MFFVYGFFGALFCVAHHNLVAADHQAKFFGVGNTALFNHSTMKPLAETETVFFDVENFVEAILKASKKNIVYKINDQLNSFYDNQTAFIHRCASTQLAQVLTAHKDRRVDKMMSYVEYFFLYKQIYLEMLNGYKNIIMDAMVKSIKQELRHNYRGNKITYEQYIARDADLDERLVFVNKAFRSGIVNHVMNVEVAMFHDMFQNHHVIFKDDEVVQKV